MVEFLRFVATIIGLDPSELKPETAYQSIPQWDSMMQLRLIMEIEEHYDLEIPLEKYPKLHNLQDFFDLIEE